MNDKSQLSSETQYFFSRHWGLEDKAPEWDFSWKWDGPVPNYKRGGLYAIFRLGELLYVGLGASKVGGIYRDRGISRRLLSHVIQISENDASVYEFQKRWAVLQADLVATIGFPADYNYLACALEDYLIGKLNPPENQMKRSRGD